MTDSTGATTFSVGDQVWVRTGLTGSHEEPAIVTDIITDVDDSSSSSSSSNGRGDSSDDGSREKQSVVVKYNVSAIEEAVTPNRVRSFDGSSGQRGGRRNRAQPDRFGSSVSAATTATATTTTTTASSSAFTFGISSPPAVRSSTRTRRMGGARASKKSAAAVTPSPTPMASSSRPSSSASLSSSSSSFFVQANEDSDTSSSSGTRSGLATKKPAAAAGGKKRAAAGRKTAAAASKKGKARKNAEDDDEKVPATPPPRKRKARGSIEEDYGEEDDEDDEGPSESPYFSPSQKKKAKTATTKAARVTKAVKSKSSNKEPAKKKSASKAKSGAPKPKKKATTRKKSTSASGATNNSTASSSSAAASAAAAAADPAPRPRAGEPDGNGGLGDAIPFRAEYAVSGRATCRRCDEKILKGELRIAHTPLFRGKPGYVVYRHLQCAVFGEHIKCAEDVDGCSDLESDDYERLAERVSESVIELEKEKEELEPDELVQAKFEGEMRPPPVGLSGKLLPFQVEGTSWMYHQEVKEPDSRGGILADEMGCGKTIQTIATILDNRPRLQHAAPGAKHPPSTENIDALEAEDELWDKSLVDWKHEMEMNNVPKSILPRKGKRKSGGGARAGTLVICPVIALTQWKTEIEKFTDPGSLSICIYHGPDRATDTPREMLRKYDVVLTTYQVLEADMRKMVSPNKIKCPNCGGKFKIDKLRVHLKYFCGEGAQRTEAQARTQRNRDRNEGGGGGGGGGRRGGGSSKKGRGSAAKKSFKKSFAQEKKTTAKGASAKKSTSMGRSTSKSAVRVKGGRDYDSESDLSFKEDVVITPSPRGRSSRSAAKQASKRMAKSVGTWMDKAVDSGDEYDAVSDSVEDDSSSDEGYGNKKPAAKKAAKKTRQPSSDESDYDDDADESSSDEDFVVNRAREKQRKALEAAKKIGKGKKRTTGKKKFPSGSGKKKSVAGKKGGKVGGKKRKKKFDDDPYSSDDSSSDSERDPLDGIDMDALMDEAMAGSQMSILHSLCWWRIVLDEAHMIKSRSSQTANAAFALIACHRWCLSGTPLQNRVGEFYSLIRFLRLDPMAHYICRQKDCNCKSLHYRMMNGKCQGCGHGSIQHYSHFNKYVLNPIQRDGYSGDGRRAMFILKDEVLDKCLLRRTKETTAEDMNLPPRLVTIRPVRLHPVEEDFYNALYTQTKTSFDDYDSSGNLRNNYAHVFDLLMRLRQSVDHPYLVVYSNKDKGAAGGGQSSGPAIANGSADCDICHEPPTDRVVSSCCQAAFCRGCVLEYMSTLGEGSTPCASCRAPFTIDLNQVQHNVVDDTTLSVQQPTKTTTSSVGMPALKELTHVASGSILRRINLAEFATSTKIEALTEELVRMRQTSPGSKAIVFSQFVNMLDLIRWRLHSDPCLADMGLGARAIHGGMDVKARDAALKDFREDNSVRVLLMSLKAGGVALNLTVANHLYLMDPWWNPAAEMQAIDRTHRLGQYRPIRAIRFIAENTVEERILQLQEKKRLVFDGTVGRDAASLKMLSVDDMKALFN